MHKDKDFRVRRDFPPSEEALVRDLELEKLFSAMSLGDKLLHESAKSAILSGTGNDLETVLYRQDILRDCVSNPLVIGRLYDITCEAIEEERKNYWGFLIGKRPSGMLHNSMGVLQRLVKSLEKLRAVAEEHSGSFKSEGFSAFMAMLKREFGDEYLASVRGHLKNLEFGEGALISAKLGSGGKGSDYRLRRLATRKRSRIDRIFHEYILPWLRESGFEWLRRLSARKEPACTFYVSPRDESGARALSELRDRGINLVAADLAQSADHVRDFFTTLRGELGFYIGCLNLYGRLERIGAPVSFPQPKARGKNALDFKGLYDIALALNLGKKITGNDANCDGKNLVMITGPNQGGKSTFLRSVGSAQLMMQCGMFVPAQSSSSSLCEGLFTHFKREEDSSMKSGKLDEELTRMSGIADEIKPGSWVLFNESFSATNEMEGSAIARQIISALMESGSKVFFVTHLYELSSRFHESGRGDVLFLRAERLADGTRTFRMIEGEPLETSYGRDLYGSIFLAD